MKISNYLDRYLVDKSYSITIRKNSVYIINYILIEQLSSSRVVVRYDGGRMILLGQDLVVSRMQDDELLIIGKIKSIEV